MANEILKADSTDGTIIVPQTKKRSLEVWWSENSFRNEPYFFIELDSGEKAWVDKSGLLVSRDVIRERTVIFEYLDNIRRDSPDYYDELVKISSSTTVNPMFRTNRVSVIIPAYYEGPHLYQLLSRYTSQKDKSIKRNDELYRGIYEINILVNRQEGAPPDNSIAEIERFIDDNDGDTHLPPINYYDIEFKPPLNTVGNARKYLADVTLLRSIQRPVQDLPLYFETEDADLSFVDPYTIANIIGRFDANPQFDALRGIQDRDPKDLMKNDWVFLKQRLWDFLEIVCRQREYRPQYNQNWHGFWHRIITGGWNTAFTAEAYAIIGGYNSHKAIGEDTEIGEKLTRVRGHGSDDRLDVNLDVIGRVATRSSSSIRRLLTERMRNIDRYKPVEFMDVEVNDLIRTKTVDELLEYPLVKQVERINKDTCDEFTDMIQKICETAYNLYDGANVFKRVMFYAGFSRGDYEINNGLVVIFNWDNVRSKLDNYRRKNDYISGDVL